MDGQLVEAVAQVGVASAKLKFCQASGAAVALGKRSEVKLAKGLDRAQQHGGRASVASVDSPCVDHHPDISTLLADEEQADFLLDLATSSQDAQLHQSAIE